MKQQLSATTKIEFAHILLTLAKEEKILDTTCMPIKSKETFTIALTQKIPEEIIEKEREKIKPSLKEKFKITYAKTQFITKEKRTLKSSLEDKIPKEKLEKLKTAFDQIGTIAILEIDEPLREYEKLIGETLLTINKSISSVYRKSGAHSGEYRIQDLVYIAGEKTTQTITIENGVAMELDVATTYFSPRLANERLRIAKQVKETEKILIMFSGIAPQAFIIENQIKLKQNKKLREKNEKETREKTSTNYNNTLAQINSKIVSKRTHNQTEKNQTTLEILCVEINPQAHEYALKNKKKLKANHTTLICADMKVYAKKLIAEKKIFDRIIMNLPKTAYLFLDEAMQLIQNNGTIHYYDFLNESEFEKAEERIQESAQKYNKNIKINGIHTVGAQGVKTYRICVDAKISENVSEISMK
jgi:tRNA (guanine37-N1)-methyltransferase